MKTDILTICRMPTGDDKIITFRYDTGTELCETMTQRLKTWEREGKLSIVDIRIMDIL